MHALTNLCLIVHHIGAIDHYEAFAKVCKENKIPVQIYAKGDIVSHLLKRNIPFQTYVNPQDISKQFTTIITDISPQSITLLQTLKNRKIMAFVDNLENNVEGGYTDQLKKIKTLAAEVLYANVHHATGPKDFGIGYSPAIGRAEKIRIMRAQAAREDFFKKHDIPDLGQKIVTFFGGANDYYYKDVVPRLANILFKENLIDNNILIVLQQHPRAKTEGNIDWNSLKSIPNVIQSEIDPDEMLSYTDVILYNQTSMSPIFCDLRVPTYQLGPKWNEDVFFRLGGALITHQEAFSQISKPFQPLDKHKLYQEIGYDENWKDNFFKAISQ